MTLLLLLCGPWRVGTWRRPQTGGARGSAATQQALALEQQGAWEEAEAAWRQVIEQNPRDATATAHLGLVLARETDYAGAAKE